MTYINREHLIDLTIAELRNLIPADADLRREDDFDDLLPLIAELLIDENLPTTLDSIDLACADLMR